METFYKVFLFNRISTFVGLFIVKTILIEEH